jgi:hypothetical protein
MEQIPSARAEGNEFLLLLFLRLWAVSGLTKRSRTRTLASKRWGAVVAFILVTATSSCAGGAMRLRAWRWVSRWRVLFRHWRGWGRGLVAAIMDQTRQQILTSSRQRPYSFFGRAELALASRVRRLLVLGRETRRRERRLLIGMRRVAWAVVVVVTGCTERFREYMRYRGQAVVCLRCRHVVDMRGLRQV